jgi:hypothetical protein
MINNTFYRFKIGYLFKKSMGNILKIKTDSLLLSLLGLPPVVGLADDPVLVRL